MESVDKIELCIICLWELKNLFVDNTWKDKEN